MLSQVLDIVDLIDAPNASGGAVAEFLSQDVPEGIEISVTPVTSEIGQTDFIKIVIPGSEGKLSGGQAPTLGVIGRLGGVGARPELIGMVSDADGCVAALAVAHKLIGMCRAGEKLPGDVIVTTHVDPDAPTEPHDPVPFMSSAVGIETMNEMEVSSEMDAILSIDTTKGNNIANHRGVCISPTVKEGYILRTAPDLVSILETVSGDRVTVLPLAQQDITPYGNDLHHVNSILQPAVATTAPVVGVALTTVTMVAGCATGASHEIDIATAAKFTLEVAKRFGAQSLDFFDAEQFDHMVGLYGSNKHFQTLGKK